MSELCFTTYAFCPNCHEPHSFCKCKSDINNIIKEINKERFRQDRKWGKQNHHPEKWLVILMEEVGEASKAILEAYPKKQRTGDSLTFLKMYREELVQVAAVAIAAIENFDRNQNIQTVK